MRPAADVVIVGSGLAGLTATLKLLKKGHSVTLLEKAAQLGGNSMKASSGINGVPTPYQTVPDSVDLFAADTLASGKGLCSPSLVDILTSRSAAGIAWLTDDLGVDLSLVTQLGGHSAPRTHRGSGKLPPGFAITSALIKQLEKYPKLTVLKESPLLRILSDANSVQGVEYANKNGKTHTVRGSNVVLASGGFSADFTDSSLIRKYRPDLLGFPSTNGEQTTGDGQKIASRDVDAKLIHMDKIQVHPTGFLQLAPGKVGNRWKFLCGELMRGIGGILLSPKGKRFVNELTTRDAVSNAMLQNCQVDQGELADQAVSILLVSDKDYPKAQHHIDFYVAMGLLQKTDTDGAVEFIKQFNPAISKDVVVDTIKSYNEGMAQEDAFSRPAFGSTFEDGFYVGAVTPVLHFSMGGIAIDEQGHVMSNSGHTFPNLYAVGEVSGGVHGANRLGGNSLLECVVFGDIVAQDIIEKS